VGSKVFKTNSNFGKTHSVMSLLFNNIYILLSTITIFYYFNNATCFGPYYVPSSGIQTNDKNISMYVTGREFCELANSKIRFTAI
jgi:hypothetical protein